MPISLKSIFGKSRRIVIGAVHYPPLLGYPDFPGFAVAGKNAERDIRAFESGGADAVIVENNYDIPHKGHVDESVVASLTRLAAEAAGASRLPVGLSVLWNDYRTALSVAKALGLKFVRVPVFVDRAQTDYGIMEPAARDLAAFRRRIGAEGVAVFADIHVKHAKIISKHSLAQSAKLAVKAGADALIVTGRWTGEAPQLSDLETVRRAVGNFPIIAGSGVDAGNIGGIFRFADAAIVSTSLKSGKARAGEINVKGYDQRISAAKVKSLVESA